MEAQVRSGTQYIDQVIVENDLERSQVHSSDFIDCKFSNCSWVESEFRNCRFINCTFHECNLSLLKVPECTFSGVQFISSKIIGVNWAQADWTKPGLKDPFQFTNCVLNHSTFIGLNLREVQFRECVAKNVDFRETNLSQAIFSGTDLSESLFSNTDISGADLSLACNYSIDPVQNNVKQARFSLPEAMSLLYSMDIILDEDVQ